MKTGMIPYFDDVMRLFVTFAVTSLQLPLLI